MAWTTFTPSPGDWQVLPPGAVGSDNPPAPSFILLPSITPNVGQIGDTFFGNAGAHSATSSYDRRWLLDGVEIGTGECVTVGDSGSLVFEVTLHGPGGDTTATSTPVMVSLSAAAPSLDFSKAANSQYLALVPVSLASAALRFNSASNSQYVPLLAA